MRLKDVEKIYRPMLHGIGWPRDIKEVALKIDEIKRLGFSLRMNSRCAVEVATENMIKEINS